VTNRYHRRLRKLLWERVTCPEDAKRLVCLSQRSLLEAAEVGAVVVRGES
jgi:hypothetical protein